MKFLAAFLITLLFIVSSNASAQPASLFKTLTTADILEKHADPNWLIVDSRGNDSFNGWALDGEDRGGHLAGAVDFSAVWLKVEAKDKEKILDAALAHKGIVKDKNIIVYDSNGRDAPTVAAYLADKGFENIYLYDFKQWAATSDLPVERFPGYQLIVPAQIVKEIIDGKKPESFENAGAIKIVEASWGDENESYAKGHVPTAFHINTDSIEPPPAWMLDTDANLAKWALVNGFKAEDTVIVTGADQLAAYRVAVVLKYIGVKDVRVLNGGDQAWTMAGYALETENHKPEPVQDFGLDIPGDKSTIVDIPELKVRLNEPNRYTLVDNRSWDEYIGKISGYSYYDKAGRIPGAVFAYAGTSGPNGLEYYRNIDNTMRNGAEITDLLKSCGIDLNKHLMFMCGSGWRAAEVLFYARVLGLENTSLYSDGWQGWSSDSNNPVETGEPK